ncbi:hypothetical protein K505DRAFT_369128 [Melanomma pulvis-pyrius CBS 109.77]|uniref:Uncharacterized protein n=1 Tax=Melanomma pulvis-pyrius CBS 109.77 TaxID=1314802 RepID=A0A6A6WN49_9PLEO|nr:hypothetical protein K505DRAFT_369128 [Melanomma pulvis-pyrius CBS 109.77]
MAAGIKDFIPYIRYKEMAGLPKGIPAHDITGVGELVVRYGEVKCRHPVGTSLCGQRLGTRGALVTHLKKQHGAEVEEADNENRPSAAYLNDMRLFYDDIMVEHDRLVAEEHAGARARAAIAAADAEGMGGLPPILFTVGPLAGENDVVEISQVVRVIRRVAPCAVCRAEHGDNITDCLFEFDVDGAGNRIVGGNHCENVGIWRL